MSVKLYSIGCASCRVLETVLDENHIEYETVSDKDAIEAAGIKTVPQLDVDGNRMTLAKAIKWARSGAVC